MQDAFIKSRQMLKWIELKLNTVKCELISDDSNTFVLMRKMG